ncbi:TraR/DksA C4-type zinc finger protein [Leptospirillum ferriphilum]|uniref:Zinc finger DksA/TraR C4-type domain-containing protein n=1 Tax=Leptospirillum ferriphilum (strain ML-04) TaxID=1048260 RepID=J9Z9S4_LEPFM|nr:TraR/DksA C4-type zinc finger protein [Leptospirillum ferriphilum]AFS52906.1 hypothetical protein LFML04_0671 [Leptospirillum ferriphilum ML-04]
MDIVDLTQIRFEHEDNLILKSRKKAERESALFCEDCGIRIPDQRRKYVLGVRTCVSCQSVRERDNAQDF